MTMQITTTANTIITHDERQQIDTDWLNYFSPSDALTSVVAHIAALPSSATPEKHTLRVYESGLRFFLAWLTNSPVETDLRDLVQRPMPLLTGTVMTQFFAFLRQTGRSARTIGSKYRAVIRHWLSALESQHIPGLTGDIRDQVEDYRHAIRAALRVQAPKKETSSQIGPLYQHGHRLRINQINDLFATLHGDDLASIRDMALIYTGIISALRVQELARITLASIEQAEDVPYTVTVRGKRGQMDPVALDHHAVRYIRRWVDAWNTAIVAGKSIAPADDPRYIDEHTPIWQPLRCGRPETLHNNYHPSRGLSRGALTGIIKRRSKDALDKAIGAHDLRRTFAANAYESKVPLLSIKTQMRHASVATTDKYIGSPQNRGAALLSNRIQFQIPA